MVLKEIALALNVSQSTVSMVLNQKSGVSAATRARVLAMLAENGYTPTAQAKKSETRKSIRFLKYAKHSMLVDGNEGFVASIIDSAEREARKRGFNLIMTSFGEEMSDEVFSMVRQDPHDGVILLGTELELEHVGYLQALQVPAVVVDNHMEFCAVDSVVMNNADIVFMALEHLHSLGHTEIGYLHSIVQTGNLAERNCAYRKVLDALGLEYHPEYVLNVGITMQKAYESLMDLLATGIKLPSALFADNDMIALGAIRALKANGYQVPGDISIIGFDDVPFCTVSDPPLTTMHVPTADIGAWTVRRLCYRMGHPDAPVMKMQFGAKLVCRESTCAYEAQQ